MFGAIIELTVAFELVEKFCVRFEILEGVASHQIDHVGRRRIDEISDGIVGFVEHLFDIDHLKKDHQLDGQNHIIGCSDVFYVVIHLIGHQPEFLEGQCAGIFFVIPAARAMPAKGMQPFTRLGHKRSGARDDAAFDLVDLFAHLRSIHHDGFFARDLEGVFFFDAGVGAWIKPHLDGAGDVFLRTVAFAHDQKFARIGGVLIKDFRFPSPRPNALGAVEQFTPPIFVRNENTLSFGDDMEKKTHFDLHTVAKGCIVWFGRGWQTPSCVGIDGSVSPVGIACKSEIVLGCGGGAKVREGLDAHSRLVGACVIVGFVFVVEALDRCVFIGAHLFEGIDRTERLDANHRIHARWGSVGGLLDLHQAIIAITSVACDVACVVGDVIDSLLESACFFEHAVFVHLHLSMACLLVGKGYDSGFFRPKESMLPCGWMPRDLVFGFFGAMRNRWLEKNVLLHQKARVCQVERTFGVERVVVVQRRRNLWWAGWFSLVCGLVWLGLEGTSFAWVLRGIQSRPTIRAHLLDGRGVSAILNKPQTHSRLRVTHAEGAFAASILEIKPATIASRCLRLRFVLELRYRGQHWHYFSEAPAALLLRFDGDGGLHLAGKGQAWLAGRQPFCGDELWNDVPTTGLPAWALRAGWAKGKALASCRLREGEMWIEGWSDGKRCYASLGAGNPPLVKDTFQVLLVNPRDFFWGLPTHKPYSFLRYDKVISSQIGTMCRAFWGGGVYLGQHQGGRCWFVVRERVRSVGVYEQLWPAGLYLPSKRAGDTGKWSQKEQSFLLYRRRWKGRRWGSSSQVGELVLRDLPDEKGHFVRFRDRLRWSRDGKQHSVNVDALCYADAIAGMRSATIRIEGPRGHASLSLRQRRRSLWIRAKGKEYAAPAYHPMITAWGRWRVLAQLPFEVGAHTILSFPRSAHKAHRPTLVCVRRTRPIGGTWAGSSHPKRRWTGGCVGVSFACVVTNGTRRWYAGHRARSLRETYRTRCKTRTMG